MISSTCFGSNLNSGIVTSSNSFPERLLKVFDRVSLVQIAERRRFRQGCCLVA